MSGTSSPLFTPPPSPEASHSSDFRLGARDIQAAEAIGSIPGLFYLPNFLTSKESEQVVGAITQHQYFDVCEGRDQAVLFGSSDSQLPSWTTDILHAAAERLNDSKVVPKETFDLLFPRLDADATKVFQGMAPGRYTRQFILNCYQPGQGIASHIDLPHQFLDGILIFSFGSGISITFSNSGGDCYDLYLRPRSLCILSGSSRWDWSHGISAREGDWVCSEASHEAVYLPRGLRLSITARWYKLQEESTI